MHTQHNIATQCILTIQNSQRLPVRFRTWMEKFLHPSSARKRRGADGRMDGTKEEMVLNRTRGREQFAILVWWYYVLLYSYCYYYYRYHHHHFFSWLQLIPTPTHVFLWQEWNHLSGTHEDGVEWVNEEDEGKNMKWSKKCFSFIAREAYKTYQFLQNWVSVLETERDRDGDDIRVFNSLWKSIANFAITLYLQLNPIVTTRP